METPSLVIVGAPHFFSRTTLRPLGPNVTLTASARALRPRSRPRRASSSYAIVLAIAKCFLRIGDARLVGRVQCPRRTAGMCSACAAPASPSRPSTHRSRVPTAFLALDQGECKVVRRRWRPRSGGRGAGQSNSVRPRRNYAAQPIPSGAGDPDAVTVPGLGLLSLSGFDNPMWLVLLVAPAALLAVYLVANERRRQRMRRFADPAAADSVAPARRSRWRHLPVTLMLLALVPLTIALAQPSHDVRVPRDRAVIMLVIDESQSMKATDVLPNRLIAAQHAAQQFARQVTAGVNLGLIAFAGSANVLVAPSPDHSLTVGALDKLAPADSTATGQAIFAALQSIHTVNAVLKGPEDKPPPARIVLLSDGKENKPDEPNNPQGAYTAARAARDDGVPITTIAFGTPAGHVAMKNETVPVPVDDGMMKSIAQLSGGQTSTAENIDELTKDFGAVEDQMGYQVESGPASAGWLRIAVALSAIGALLALLINRRLPV